MSANDTEITAAAGRIMDVWMGGDTTWRERVGKSLMLDSEDWAQAMRLARAALNYAKKSDIAQGLRNARDVFDSLSIYVQDGSLAALEIQQSQAAIDVALQHIGAARAG